jgi:hypothetical protein
MAGNTSARGTLNNDYGRGGTKAGALRIVLATNDVYSPNHRQ